MPNILIQFAHPAFSKSRVHKMLLKACRSVEGVTVNDLYEQYPDLYIDVQREQQLLLQHDIIVLQHPFYWYSGPAIIKQWMDLVLEYNWAYGPRGTALAGKKMLNAISCGGRQEAYTNAGYNQFPVTQFLLPFRQTASLCRMEYLPPFIVYGTYKLPQENLHSHGLQYANVLKALVQGSLLPEQYNILQHLNEAAVEQ